MQVNARQISLPKRMLLVFFVFFFVFTMCFPPVVRANAAEATTYYIQTAVDSNTWKIAAAVVNDKSAWFGNFTEGKRIGSDSLKKLMTTEKTNMFTDMLGSGDNIPKTGSGGDKDYRVLSFPGFNPDKIFQSTPPASSAQHDRAMFIKDNLVFDLNNAINVVYPNLKCSSLSDFRNKISDILLAVENNGSVNGWRVERLSDSEENNKKYKNEANDVNPSDYVKFSKEGSNESYVFMTSAKKYIDSMQDADKPSDEAKDTKYITWGMIVYEALINSTLEKDAVTSDTVYNSTVHGVLEGAVTDLMSNLLSGIRSILGLWDLDSLVFNRGARGSLAFVSGIFPSSWEGFIWTMFLVSELLSLAIIMYAIAKNIANRAAATVNPAIRANALEQIKDMAVGILVLIMLPALIIGLMRMSASLVNVFDSMVSGKSITEGLTTFSSGSSLAAVIVGFANLIILVYFNWFYIIRQITTAFLICLAPIFISMMCVGTENRSTSVRWLSELLANIFIQPAHAMLFAFIILLPKNSRPIESLIMLYCCIPLTRMLKGLLFPGTNDLTDRISSNASQKASDMAKKTATATAGATLGLGKGIKTLSRAKDESGREASHSGVSAGESNMGDSNIKQRNINTSSAKSTPVSKAELSKKEVAQGAGDVSDTDNRVPAFNFAGRNDIVSGAENSSKASTGEVQKSKSLDKNPFDLSKENHNESEKNFNGITGRTEWNDSDQSTETSQRDLEDPVLIDQTKEKMVATNEGSKGLIQRMNTPEGKKLAASWDIVAGATMAGMIRGWRGQVFSDAEKNTKTQNAYKDYLNASNETSQQDMESKEEIEKDEVRQSKANNAIPTIPFNRVGDTFMTDKDDASVNGIEKLQTFRGDNGQQVSYEMDQRDMSATDRTSFEQITSDPELHQKAKMAGYNVDKIYDRNGDFTGKYHVGVGQNDYTGAPAPALHGSDIMHGGTRNNLIPNVEEIQTQAANYDAYQGYQSRVANANAQINEIRSDMTSKGMKMIEQVENREQAGFQSSKFLQKQESVYGNGSAIAMAQMLNGSTEVKKADNGEKSVSFTASDLSYEGIHDFHVSDDNNVSYKVAANEATNGRIQAVVQSVRENPELISQYESQGVTIKPIQMTNPQNNEQIVEGYQFSTNFNGGAISSCAEAGGTQTYTVNQSNKPFIPTPITQRGQTENQMINAYASHSRQNVIQTINTQTNEAIQKVEMPTPTNTESIGIEQAERAQSQKSRQDNRMNSFENRAGATRETERNLQFDLEREIQRGQNPRQGRTQRHNNPTDHHRPFH